MDEVVDAAEEASVDIAYLFGRSPEAEGPEFPLIDPDRHERSVEYMKEAIDVAAEVRSSFVNVISGHRDGTLNPAQHHLPIVDALREEAPRAERAGVTALEITSY